MRILGADLPRGSSGTPDECTLVLLDDRGRVGTVQTLSSLLELATAVSQLAGGEPFLLGVNVPVVVPGKPSRARPVENLIRRRMGFRLPPGGRAALTLEPQGVAGETLMAGLAAAGHPCLPYPDRDRRQSGLAETHPHLVLKALLWQTSPLAGSGEPSRLEALFRAYDFPVPRADSAWAASAAATDLVLRALGSTAEDFDLDPARRALATASSGRDVERARGLLDASLIAGTARRYLESPEACAFVGDRESGYLILPADSSIRRLALADHRASRGRLFPKASLRERLLPHAQLRLVDLLEVPGKPQRIEATFREIPEYEFDNLDEMLWWKHCRHVAGLNLPTEGLRELLVTLTAPQQLPEVEPPTLKLIRSRHKTLSFRFEPPGVWRAHVPTRDGRTYPFRVLRALYDTAPAE